MWAVDDINGFLRYAVMAAKLRQVSDHGDSIKAVFES